jgi:hypothetical protein
MSITVRCGLTQSLSQIPTNFHSTIPPIRIGTRYKQMGIRGRAGQQHQADYGHRPKFQVMGIGLVFRRDRQAATPEAAERSLRQSQIQISVWLLPVGATPTDVLEALASSELSHLDLRLRAEEVTKSDTGEKAMTLVSCHRCLLTEPRRMIQFCQTMIHLWSLKSLLNPSISDLLEKWLE